MREAILHNWQLRVRTILCCLIANLSAISVSYAAPVQFFRDTTISASDFSHDGQDIIINGALLTIDGSHQFNSVTLLNSAVLTHSISPATPLIIHSTTFFIDYSSTIDLVAKGKLPTAAVTGASGGSYGGLGGEYLGSTNPVFGDEKFPTDFGIGGIGSKDKTRGGGAIRIVADNLVIDGRIIADGESFNTFFYSQGGGSGGSIWLDTGTLSGTGTIETSGGSGFTFNGGSGGGGGRIAVYYQSTDFDLQNNIINVGGTCKPLYGEHGQPGTIYLEKTSDNLPPIADAGNDISVNELTSVTLSGSGQDSDGSITAYQWTQTGGTAVTLNANDETASFTTPRLKTSETLVFRLTVTDNETGTGSDEVRVTVNPVNTPPIATIIKLDPVAENTTAMLDGSTSRDPDVDGAIVRYRWTQIDGPNVTLNNATRSVASFVAPSVYQDTGLGFRLNIFDDEGGTASATINVTVYSVNPDDDADNMLDLWEIDFFGTLDHDGTLDSDNDGATDLQEHDLGTDPTVEQQPAQPEIVSPDDIEVNSLQPTLTLINPNQHPDFSIAYQYEVHANAAMSDLTVTSTTETLIWLVNTSLSDNTHYYWRARAVGTTLYSEWVDSTFFVNTENDAPGVFNISYPQDGVWVASFTPTLSVNNSVDIDEDALSYSFEIYLDGDLTQSPVASVEGLLPGENGTTSWTVDVNLLENNWYSWRAIVTDEHGLSTVSNSTPMIFINTVNDAPSIPVLHSPVNNSEITTLYPELVVNNASDPELEAIHYLFEIDTVNTFDSANKQSSDPVTETPNLTGWSVNQLLDNSWYYWRAKASDGLAESPWVNGRMFVNQFNDAPSAPNALNPGDNAWVGSLQPTLEVYPATDIDGDTLSYEFEVYKAGNNSEGYELIMAGNSSTTSWQLDLPLDGSGYYYWHARAIDEHDLAGEWGNLTMFFADDDGINDTPVIKLKYLKYEHGGVLAIHKYENEQSNMHGDASFVEIRWKDTDPDSNARISLYIDTDRHGEDGALITQDILEDPDDKSDRFMWDISQMAPGIYYVYAVIDDGFSTSVNYSRNAVVVGNGGGLPFLIFNSPSVESEGKSNQQAKIEWRDLDYNSNALISFYYDSDNADFDGMLIVDAIYEDPDHKDDKYMWDVSTMPEGIYYIYAIISDETSSYRVYAEEPFTIHHGNNGH